MTTPRELESDRTKIDAFQTATRKEDDDEEEKQHSIKETERKYEK
jgi:hypothetical protein